VNRALRAAAIGVLLIGPVALSACSAGQINQTASQNRDKVGALTRVGDLTLRGVEIAYPQGGSYARGDDAVLNGAIVNDGTAADRLVSITGQGFTGIDVTGTGAQASAASGTASPSGTGAATTTAAGTSASTTGAATTTGATTTGATTTGATTTGATTTGATTTGAAATTTAALPTEAPSNDVGISIPGNSAIFLGQNAPHVTLAGLTEPLNAAQSLRLTFTFQRAGAVTVVVLIANPGSALPRTSSFDFEPTESVTPSAGSNG
jgi:copper(I)-binding protein